jgi:hypothetical protein
VKELSYCNTVQHADDYDSAIYVLEIAMLLEDVIPA